MFRYFEKRVDPFPRSAPKQPPKDLLAFLAHYSRPMLPWLLVMSVLTALVAVAELAIVHYFGSLVDWLAGTERGDLLSEHGRALLLVALFVVVGYPLLVLFQSLISHQTIFGNYPMLVRWSAHRYLLGQSLGFFQDEFAGRVSQKVMQTAIAVRESVLKLMDVFVYIAVYFVGAMFLVGRADLWLTAPLIGWLAAYIAITVYFVPRLRVVSMAQANARAQMTGRIVDSYTNIQTIKLFAHTLREHDYARGAMSGFLDTVHRQMRLVTRLTVALQTVNALLLASVGAVAVFAWQQGVVTLGAIAVAIALVMRIRSMSDWMLWEVAGLFENIGTVQDGINTIAQPAAVRDRPGAPALEAPRGEIRFDRVHFGYGKRPLVLHDFSLTIQSGERIGLIGRSGAGKSTLINLLLRFHDLEGGRILIDGQDIAAVQQESLRAHIGMVTQDTSLLHRSIADNIRYGRPEASDEEVIAAARKAHAHEFIQNLSDAKGRRGYQAHAGERGVKLSGGQRQRIAIARVLLKDAPILVLDEATSALDSEVEAAIQAQLDTLMEGKTVIAIAHRLSTIAMMDRLVVIDEGQVVETGTHDELLREGGLYASLWRRQSGGFLSAEAEVAAG